MLYEIKNIVNDLKINISGIIHVGANEGEELSSYLHYTTNIHMFEPIQNSYEKIPNIVKKYNCALGDVEGTFELNVANNSQSSSLLKPKRHLQEHPEVLFIDKILVPVKTLDSFNIQNCNFLNMDVQGYELHVLKGATNTLKHIDVIYTEVNMDEIYEGNCLIEDLDAWLFNYSFKRVWHYDTGHRWGDAIYIRK